MTRIPPPKSEVRCDRIMVGSGTDTYDPTCDLPEGHDGSCKSTAAVDQHRLPPDWKTIRVCAGCGLQACDCEVE